MDFRRGGFGIFRQELSNKHKAPKRCHGESCRNICLSKEQILQQAQNDIKIGLFGQPPFFPWICNPTKEYGCRLFVCGLAV